MRILSRLFRKPSPPRDREGRFVSEHHQKVITAAKALRAEVDARDANHQWSTSL